MTTIRNQTGEELFFEQSDQSKIAKGEESLEVDEGDKSQQTDQTDSHK